jgi:hypothetical protein
MREAKCRSDVVHEVVEGVGWLILHHAQSGSDEQSAASVDANVDESEDRIEKHKRLVYGLRKIRDDFENLTTGLL